MTDPAPHVTLAGFLLCRSLDEADRVAAILPDHIRATRTEPGCLSFQVIRSMSDPLRFAVHEVFRDAAAFAHHQAAMRASAWWQATRHIPREYRMESGEADGDPPPPAMPE